MDRVRVAVPTLVAAIALLGQQGARLGPFLVPEIGFRWVLVAITVFFFLTPKRDERRLGARDAMLAAAFALGFHDKREEQKEEEPDEQPEENGEE